MYESMHDHRKTIPHEILEERKRREQQRQSEVKNDEL